MLEKLEREPRAADELSGYSALATTSILLSGVGGGLIGWPLGQAAAGEDPLWVLAAIGGGLIAVGIPLAIVADNKVESAVDAHNEDLNRLGWMQPTWTIGRQARTVEMCEVEAPTAEAPPSASF
jgi:hypothetical protein